ncbi:tetracycline resistance protein, class D-like [Microplitis mediator]|uniref:tetracycline resistance protein, class D-like n=1 Tax=Microplitis mediator TaxID=375433 RepID=UPI0025578FE4|nr:tetracycline resistance protein, class D-like [Microplitis mediator]
MEKKCIKLIKTGGRCCGLMEPIMFLLLLVDGMQSNVFIDMILFQTCRKIKVGNETDCNIIQTNSSSEEARELNKIVQLHASYVIMSKSLMTSILPSFLILFLGPWSDKYGRKPLLIIGTFVPLCRYTILSILSIFDSNPWMFLLAFVPSVLLGNGCLLATICYISDTTVPEKRSWRLACLQTSLRAGLLIGTFIGPLIFQKLGYTFLFIIAALICSLSLLYVVFMVPESLQNKPTKKWGNPFDFSLVKQLITTCTKKRDSLNRELLWSCLLVLSLIRIIIDGSLDINYLFAHAKLGWNIVQYSMFNSLSMVTLIIGTFCGIKVMKDYIGFADITQILMGCLSGFLASLCLSFATESWHMYLHVCLGFLSGIILPTLRSLISKSAPSDDLGKVFCLVSFIDTLLPLGSAPLYNLIYSSLIFVYPSPVYLMTSGIYFLMIIINRIMNLRLTNQISSNQCATQSD